MASSLPDEYSLSGMREGAFFCPIRTPQDLAHHLAQIARCLEQAISTVLTTQNVNLSDLLSRLCVFAPVQEMPSPSEPGIAPATYADMYAQTIVYGMFATHMLGADMSSSYASPTPHPLSHQGRGGGDSGSPAPLDEDDGTIGSLIAECARLLAQTDIAAVMKDFGKATRQHDPLTHFYETFLAAYDPTTRAIRGVYYTPEPVVSYMVRSIDRLLQTHCNRPLGLADSATTIIDPAMGTATFLHAVVQHISTTRASRGIADTWRDYVSTNLLPRLAGFELLMAPYTIAHLKLHMLLQQSGYTFGKDERLRLCLSNALDALPASQSMLHWGANIPSRTGAQARRPDNEPDNLYCYSPHDNPVMVVLGNPPYSNYGKNNTSTWIHQQLATYKHGLRERKLNLNDDYIKFMRLGQWCIEQAGQGILAFVTNNTYIDGITHRRMRQSLLDTFTDLYILNLHGNTLKEETSPDGTPDENIFDIRQGIAISMFVKRNDTTNAAMPTKPQHVYYADMWGTRESKYTRLAASDITTTEWTHLHPQASHFFFVPKDFSIQAEYAAYWGLEDIALLHRGAIKTDRDSLVFDFDYNVLDERMRMLYSDAGLSADFRARYRVENTSSYDILNRREKTAYSPEHLHRCLYRPFDVRWLYYNPFGFTSRPSYDVMHHMQAGDNLALLVCRQQAITGFTHVFCTEHIAESHAVSLKTREGAFMFPLYLYPHPNARRDTTRAICPTSGRCPNFSAVFIAEMEQRLGMAFIPDGRGNLHTTIGPEDIFHYIYATLHCPTYRTRYAELLKIALPRIPLPNDSAAFTTLVAQGAKLVDLHLLRLPGSGGVGGAGGAAGLVNPSEQGVTQHNVTLAPIQCVRYDEQQQRIVIGKGMYVAGVAPATWAMHIGSYRPLRKWLKDHIRRTLSTADALHYMRMVVALGEGMPDSGRE